MIRAHPSNPDIWQRWDGSRWRFHCRPDRRQIHVERRGVMLDAWLRYCRRPVRVRWWYTLRVGGHSRVGGRR